MKKLGLILLVVVMAIGALGVAYATLGWNSTATLNETVSMGTVVAGVAAVSGNATNAGSYLGGGWYDTVNVTITNAYPGQIIPIAYQIGNIGTIAVKFTLTPLVPSPIANLAIFSTATNSYAVTGYFTGTYNNWADFKAAVESVTFPAGTYITVNQTQTLSSGLLQSLQGQSVTGGTTVFAVQSP